MNSISQLVRKAARTAQVHIPHLQNAGKAFEAAIRSATGKLHDPDLEGLRSVQIPPGALFLDIGANRGSAALSFWRIAPNCKIICFEPNAPLADRFLRPIERRGAIVHKIALGDEPGQFPLYVPVYNGVVFDGLASLNKVEAAQWLSERTLFGFQPQKLQVMEQICEVVCLDSFNLDPFFIKIDVQGREAAVIKGGLGTIARALPIIFAESESLDIDSVTNMLRPLEYDYYAYDGKALVRGRFSRSNIYLIPQTRAVSKLADSQIWRRGRFSLGDSLEEDRGWGLRIRMTCASG
ncbi:MAG: FkbM family methyltransferase [Alphaproteobacteria bacterium]